MEEQHENTEITENNIDNATENVTTEPVKNEENIEEKTFEKNKRRRKNN